MKSWMKKLSVMLLSIIVVVSLAMPALSFAQPQTGNSGNDANAIPSAMDLVDEEVVIEDGVGNVVAVEATESTPATSADANVESSDKATDCTVTLEYYENVSWEEPGIPPNDEGRYLLGKRVLTGLTEGQVLDTWDYVVKIPGYIFFDAWPGKLEVSADPAKNVIKLFYFRLWNYSYTVNYYVMTGADLTADNWSAALEPETVKFTKVATEVFENEPYGKLVEGDAYEYKVDGMYVIDTYPAEIRVGVKPDDNTINVLYTMSLTTLPDEIEIPEELKPEIPPTPGTTPSLPDDSIFDKDEIVSTLPSDTITVPGTDTPGGTMSKAEIDQLFRDFIGDEYAEGTMEITDEMLADPMDRETAKQLMEAYITGQENALASVAHGPETTNAFVHTLCIIIMIILAALAIIGFSLYGREHHRLKEATAAEGGAGAGADDTNRGAFE